MVIRFGIVMDPIENIQIKKDSSFAILLEAARREWEIYYIKQEDIYLLNGDILANSCCLDVEDNEEKWFTSFPTQTISLKELDVIFIRLDPPFDTNYLYTTLLLEQVEREGTLIINKPQGLREANEKLFANWFVDCCPPTLVTQDESLIKEFLNAHKDIILKPLDCMGGKGVFRIKEKDQNINVIIEMLTQNGALPIMAQVFIKEVIQGDKRILMVNGKPIPYVLLRIPKKGEIRANIAAGGAVKGVELTEKDRWICDQVGPVLRKKGLFFVGLDIIGDYLTEINVTSPTGIRQLDNMFNINIAGELLTSILELMSLDQTTTI